MRVRGLVIGCVLAATAVLAVAALTVAALTVSVDRGSDAPPRTPVTATPPSAPVTTTPRPAPRPAPPAPRAPAPAPAPKPPKRPNPTPCESTAAACVDLSANKAWLLDNGVVTYGPVPITHGRPGYRTPPGTFRVGWKDIDHLSRAFGNAPMPYSVFFNGGIAFHAGSLRQPSHGCIHLSNAAAKAFYNALGVGAVVQVVR